VLAGVNYFAWPFAALVASGGVAEAGFNISRVCLMVWAGFAVVRKGASGLLGAGFAGIAILVVDHIALKGGGFLLEYARGKQIEQLGPHSYLMAFGGVVASFIMFSPVAAGAGLCGGMLGRSNEVRDAA